MNLVKKDLQEKNGVKERCDYLEKIFLYSISFSDTIYFINEALLILDFLQRGLKYDP